MAARLAALALSWLASPGVDAPAPLDLQRSLMDELATLYDVQAYPGVDEWLRPGVAVVQRGHYPFEPTYRLLCNAAALHSQAPRVWSRSLGVRMLQVRFGDCTPLSVALEELAATWPELEGLTGLDLEVHRARRWTLSPETQRNYVHPTTACLASIQLSGAIDDVPCRVHQVVTGSLTVALVWREEELVTELRLPMMERLARRLLAETWSEAGHATIYAENLVLGGADDSGLFLDRMAL